MCRNECDHKIGSDNLITKLIKVIKRMFPVTLFLIVTYAIFTPSSLFLNNINEFSLQYIRVIPIIAWTALKLWAIISIIPLCLKWEKAIRFYMAFLFSIVCGGYIQSNFLNPAFSSLDGTAIDWSLYALQGRVSAGVWIICILATILSVVWWGEKLERVIKYISYFLSAVQIASLLVLVLTCRLDDSSNYGFSKEGQFSVGSDENIILFVVDTLQAAAMEEYIASDAFTEGELQNFTFFDNAVSGGAPTQLAMPVLLTGMEYDPMQSEDEYKQEMWEETMLYRDLHENGYDVRFFTELGATPGIPDGIADNYVMTGNSWIEDYFLFGKQLYKLVNFYVMPQFLKEKFWVTTDAITETITKVDSSYRIDDVQFYREMDEMGGVFTDNKKTFRLYHLKGVHAPYNMNENLEKVEEGSVTEQQQLQGIMKVICVYLEAMKQAGIYETSTIIIVGDHGRHESGNLESNPAVLIKRAKESHPLEINSAPIHFRNVVATIADAGIDDYSCYGPSAYDITGDSDVERLHTINNSVRRRLVLDKDVEEAWYYRFIIPDEADVQDEYHIWNPYEINRISYNIGEIINFVESDSYAEQINYRLYKDKEGAIASNELSLCFELKDYHQEDLEFHFIYSDVYNNLQKARIYVNGNKIENVVCMSDEAEDEKIVEISKDLIKDNILILRMVFPNAVTPNQIDRINSDTRVLSVVFNSMWLEKG